MKIDKIISSYTLRHAYATQYYKQTKDIEILRRISDHLDTNSTNNLHNPGQY